MSLADDVKAPIRHADRFFIGGQWVQPSSDATIKVIDSGTEELFFSVAEAQAADISRAVEAARQAFDAGPWPRLTHAERAGYLRTFGAELSVSFGGFKQSGIGREGGREGLLPFLETKFVILEGRPAGYEDTTL
jgi:acyl-CoA reductase-like NAD-dependent aldehyde dehydrogenase